MAMQEPRYPMEEFARRGEELYEHDIRSKVEAENEGKVVAIDIETGAFELGADALKASDALLARCPGAQIWFVRVGFPALHRIGSPRLSRGQ
jgi:hypothetical protein